MSPADSILAIPGKYPLKVSLAGHRGRVVIDVRYHYLHAESGRLKPTMRGVTLPAASLHEIIAALEAIKAEMIRDGYLNGDNPPKIVPHVYPSDF